MQTRKIIHVDMDAFYASVEQRDNPEFRGKPVAVGHAGPRGVVAAASYEARKYGVRSAMSSQAALKKCPNLIFTHPRFEVYKSVSMQIRSIFLEYTPLVEPLSLDEAFLDVTFNLVNNPSATLIAKEIKEKIKAQTGLTASAGVSINKFLAKIASDYRKPDGLFVIPPKKAYDFVAQLDIERFYGIGKVTAERMHKLGIYTGAQLREFSMQHLESLFGKAGQRYYQFARAIDDRPVCPDREYKSVGTENTFATDLDKREDLLAELQLIQQDLCERVRRKSFAGKTLTLKVKFGDFKQITRSRTVAEDIHTLEQIKELSEGLLSGVDLTGKKVRLMGISINNNARPKPEEPLQLRIEFEEFI
ncbi:MAG: DNA polymerase IV [Tannerellaceae bacterium]